MIKLLRKIKHLIYRKKTLPDGRERVRFLFFSHTYMPSCTLLLRELKKMEEKLASIEQNLAFSDRTDRVENQKIYAAIQSLRTIDKFAQLYHPQVFQKYKGIHKGQDIVIIGTGPTLDAYTPIPGAIHIGANRSYRCEKLKLDYLFAQDGGPGIEVDELAIYRKGECRKFFGVHPMACASIISDSFASSCEAERYYFNNEYLCYDDPNNLHLLLPHDLAHQPFYCAYSVIMCAFQFALWCRPRRIYIVGCDCANNGYFKGDPGVCKQFLVPEGIITEWHRMAALAKRHYADVEIISINPVGLKGLFKDQIM